MDSIRAVGSAMHRDRGGIGSEKDSTGAISAGCSPSATYG
jgi:hypothetical protein